MQRGHQWDSVADLEPAKHDWTRDAADSASVLGGGWHLPTFTGDDSGRLGHTAPVSKQMAVRAAMHYGYGHKN